MKRLYRSAVAVLFAVFAVVGCSSQPGGPGWVNLIDGDKGLDNFNRIGDANWRAESGAIVADKGKGGHLVSKSAYKDFVVRAEFWAASDTNSGIFIRASDPKRIGADNAYEVNIWDIREGAQYRSGAIVNHASVPVPTVYKVGGNWNTMIVTARGDELTVELNGTVTAHIRNSLYKEGPFSLQYGAGVKGATGGPIKWRRVDIKPL